MQKFSKRAFTLAEILIVLTIIGVMAVMTIPSLIQGTNSTQKVTLFKKAFNAITNAYATEFAVKAKPTGNTEANQILVFNALKNQLNVKYFVKAKATSGEGASASVASNAAYSGEKLYEITSLNNASKLNLWIVTEDGIGYKVEEGGSATCDTKLNINSQDTSAKAKTKSCVMIKVDVGGIKSTNTECADNDDVNDLRCDQTYFYVSDSGITSGNPDSVATGKIINKDNN